MHRITQDSKFRENRGTGDGINYKPWIKVGEFGSLGTASCPVDYKTGRTVHLMSQGEAYLWQILRYDDLVVDIKEQYPLLPVDNAINAAKELNLAYPYNDDKEPIVMTTDFLVIYADGTKLAISFKDKLERIKEDRRTLEKLNIEYLYWKNKNINFKVMCKDDIDINLANNLRVISYFYNLPSNMYDNISVVKHLIARKLIKVNLSSFDIDYKTLAIQYRKEIELWKQQNTLQTSKYYLE